ncbi:ABC transporter substrate-binding protein [Undibacterium terreum]|uniref:Branched-chain amino acid ABC transporter substrate-binding protein n=1 Tax=Undibacterium terreum TaxID=1224302 RepID=A0A916U3Z7_9BURK|nr:ABC transporter substrate-binding protein [Undibacterium terreum]GGC59755.1 branched-chain amino acid ABC transporter substrate-binding protein [Undibacterium terreum]
MQANTQTISIKYRDIAITALLAFFCVGAQAQIRIGVTISSTGPAASLGIPEKNAIAMLPKEIAGNKVEYIVLDDASDTTQTVTNTRKLISEEKVDAIIGSTTTPNSLAMLPVLGEGKTAAISLASSNRIIEPMDANRAWMFKTPQTDTMMAIAIAEDMSRAGVKSMGFIGFSDALGEAFLAEVSKYAELKKIKVAVVERYSRNDSSVVGQVLKLMSANPDAIVVGASGTPAALPPKTLVERGYKGRIYHNHGVANSDFLRVCGKDCELTFLPTGPVMVAKQLPDSSPVKKAALDFSNKFEAAYGAGSLAAFASYAWDAGLLLQNTIPLALKRAKPGTLEFRAALRDALENIKGLPTTNGVVNMSKNDHLGLDQRARVMVQIKNGKWSYFSE